MARKTGKIRNKGFTTVLEEEGLGGKPALVA